MRSLAPVSAALAAFLLFCAPAPAPAQEPPASAAPAGRVVVLGIDGMDARLAQQWMDAGELPNFARLREQGTFAPLTPGNPAQSPVSWATLNTGKNPGKHGIFDFVRNVRFDSGRSTPAPDIGFQQEVMIAPEQLRYPPAGGSQGLLFLALGCAAALVLLVLLRRQLPIAIVAALLALGGGAYGFLSQRGGLPKGFADWESLCQAQEYWYALDQAGVPFRGHGVIVDYPATTPLQHGQLICGLGAPDAKGRLNTWAVYTTLEQRQRQRRTPYKSAPAYSEDDVPSLDTPSGVSAGSGKIYRLVETAPGTWTSKLYGPLNLVRKEELEARRDALEQSGGDPEELERVKKLLQFRNADLISTWVPLEVKWSTGDAQAEITVGGQRQTVALHSWSDFFKLRFRWSGALETHAMVRLWAEPDGNGLELYAAALQIDPRHPTPASRICWPPDFAGQVAERIGDYETLGWACETHSVKDAELSEEAFVKDIEFTEEWRFAMLKDALADPSWRVLFHFFGSPDRVCHMMMHRFDPQHPEFDAAAAEREYDFFGRKVQAKDVIPALYRQMDHYLGELLAGLQPDDVLLVVSDHGFDSFRRQVNLNTWLAAEGFLALKEGVQPGAAEAVVTGYADWSGTKAYSMGIGKIFLNRKGRERNGIVSDAEADAVVAEIEQKLRELTDPDSGEKIVRQIYRREDIYSGDWWKEKASSDPAARVEGAPELTIDFAPGYRASWSCTGGGIDLEKDGEGNVVLSPVVYDNDKLWSGDHCGVDMAVVQGVFFSNRRLSLPSGDDHYDATHLAPTVLRLAGVPVPADYDRKPLE